MSTQAQDRQPELFGSERLADCAISFRVSSSQTTTEASNALLGNRLPGHSAVLTRGSHFFEAILGTATRNTPQQTQNDKTLSTATSVQHQGVSRQLLRQTSTPASGKGAVVSQAAPANGQQQASTPWLQRLLAPTRTAPAQVCKCLVPTSTPSVSRLIASLCSVRVQHRIPFLTPAPETGILRALT